MKHRKPKIYTLVWVALLLLMALGALQADDTTPTQQLRLPPPETPAQLVKPTPTDTEAQAELAELRNLLPKAFYDPATFPEHYRSLVEIKAKDEYEKDEGYHFDKIIRGDHHRMQITLTFDDGPHPKYTIELLNLLQKENIHATFFVVGKQVVKYPVLVQLEYIEGHDVGNHTYDHVNLTLLPPHLVQYELDACDRAIKAVTGSSVRFFRPPGGDYDGDVVREAAARGYVTTLWTDDPGDYTSPGADVILKRTLDNLEPGAVILLHDGIPQTIQILPQLIAEARRRGYEFVPLSQLALEK
jgi:peptidoglycan-N-acetylglucosamine deacetylase